MAIEINQTAGLKRFNILSIVIMAALILHFILFSFHNIPEFDKYSCFFFFGLGFWFFMDEEMLSVDAVYFKCLLWAIVIFAYGYSLRSYYPDQVSHVTGGSSLSTLTLLLVQWPLRRLYIQLFKTEPEIDTDGTFGDVLYTMILFLGWIVLPIIISDYFK